MDSVIFMEHTLRGYAPRVNDPPLHPTEHQRAAVPLLRLGKHVKRLPRQRHPVGLRGLRRLRGLDLRRGLQVELLPRRPPNLHLPRRRQHGEPDRPLRPR